MKNLSQTWYQTLQAKEIKKEGLQIQSEIVYQLDSGIESDQTNINPADLIAQLLQNHQVGLAL